MRCLNGEIFARLVVAKPGDEERAKAMGVTDLNKVYRSKDLAPGQSIIFAATGVTEGSLMNPLRHVQCAVAALALFSLQANAQELTARCESAPLVAALAEFNETGRIPPHAARFFADSALQQKIEPYKAFDNVYYVGICWVSAWLLTSQRGHVLIDTLYEPHVDHLLANIRALGFDPKDIMLVVITHGHNDHAGGAARVKSLLDPGTRFA